MTKLSAHYFNNIYLDVWYNPFVLMTDVLVQGLLNQTSRLVLAFLILLLTLAPDAVMLADARAPAVLAPAPDAVMLADARAPAVLAPAPLAVMLALPPDPRLCYRHPRPLPLPLPRA